MSKLLFWKVFSLYLLISTILLFVFIYTFTLLRDYFFPAGNSTAYAQAVPAAQAGQVPLDQDPSYSLSQSGQTPLEGAPATPAFQEGQVPIDSPAIPAFQDGQVPIDAPAVPAFQEGQTPIESPPVQKPKITPPPPPPPPPPIIEVPPPVIVIQPTIQPPVQPPPPVQQTQTVQEPVIVQQPAIEQQPILQPTVLQQPVLTQNPQANAVSGSFNLEPIIIQPPAQNFIPEINTNTTASVDNTVTSTNINTNTNANNNNNTNVQNQSNNQSVVVGSGGFSPPVVSQPQVVFVPTSTTTTVPVQTQVKSLPKSGVSAVELPKTGPPLVAWALSGLIPLGWRLRRFDKEQSKKDLIKNFIWQKRENNKEEVLQPLGNSVSLFTELDKQKYSTSSSN